MHHGVSLPKCVLPYLRHSSLMTKIYELLQLIIISRRALAREGDYKMHPVRACV